MSNRSKIRKQVASLLLLLLLALMAIPTPARAQQSPQALFDQANTQLQEGQIIEALSSYRKLTSANAVSGSLYLNMGISYVRLDSLGKAKYYFLKASRFDETEERAAEGLNYVEERFSRQSAVLPKLPWEKAIDWLKNNVGSSVLLGLGIILFNLGIIGIITGWFNSSWQRHLKISGITLSAIGLSIVLLSFYTQYLANRYQSAVMVHQQANVMEKPTDESAMVSQAYEGYTFTVDTHQSRDHTGWKYVRMSNGLYGWIPSDKIMIL